MKPGKPDSQEKREMAPPSSKKLKLLEVQDCTGNVSSSTSSFFSPGPMPLQAALEKDFDYHLTVPVTPLSTGLSRRSTELHRTVQELSVEALEAALKAHAPDINVQDERGFTPLMNAAAITDDIIGPKLVSLLLNNNAEVNLRDQSGYTALHWSVAIGSVGSIRLLHSAGADPNDNGGEKEETPLHRGCRFSRHDAVAVLLDLGADVSALNSDLELPIDIIGQLPSAEPDLQSNAAVRKLLLKCDPSRKLLVLHHPDCLDHVTLPGHQEAPARISAIIESLSETFDISRDLSISTNFAPASLEAVKKVHSKEYVDFIVQLSKQVGDSGASVPFTPRVQTSVRKIPLERVKSDSGCDTSFSKGSLAAALRGCGALCHAIDEVVRGTHRTAFACVRPPGHHSGVKGLMFDAPSCGFCVLNSICVAALHALSVQRSTIQRVAIVDFDVHHGNGTEDIVRALRRPSQIFFCSVHLWDGEFYPCSGNRDDMAQNIMNIAIPPLWRKSGVKSFDETGGRAAFRKAITNKLAFALRCFNPDIILLSAGFDGAKHDVGNKRFGIRQGVTGLDLKSDDFYFITSKIIQVAEICCEGRVVSVLEGGYGRAALPTPAGSHGSKAQAAVDCCPLDLGEFSKNVAGHLRGLAHMGKEANTTHPSANSRTSLAPVEIPRRTRKTSATTSESSVTNHSSTRSHVSEDLAFAMSPVAASQALAAAEKGKRGSND